MQKTRLALGALALAVTLTGCSFPGLGYRAKPLGGAELEGAGDHIYFDLQNVAGFAPGGWVLVLPADWPERERVRRDDDVLGLVEPLELTWVRFDQASPRVEMIEPGFSLERSREAASALMSDELVEIGGIEFYPLEARRMAASQKRLGANFYYVYELRERVSATDETKRYEIYGAVPLDDNASEPDDAAVANDLVHLATVEFVDQRNEFERGVDGTYRFVTKSAGLVVEVPVFLVRQTFGLTSL